MNDESVPDEELLLAARTDAQAFTTRLGIPPIALDDAALERIESVAESEAAAAGLAVALDALTLRQRDALEARVVDGEDYGAIAVASGVSEATIRKRVSRALHTLRDAMGGQR